MLIIPFRYYETHQNMVVNDEQVNNVNHPCFCLIHFFYINFSSIGDRDVSQIKTFVGISQTEHDYLFMCSTGSVYRYLQFAIFLNYGTHSDYQIFRLSNVDEQSLTDLTTFNGETSVADVSKSLLSGVELERVNEETNDTHIETFCVVSSNDGDMIVSSSKKYLYIQANDTKCKIKIPKIIDSFKAIYNLDRYL